MNNTQPITREFTGLRADAVEAMLHEIVLDSGGAARRSKGVPKAVGLIAAVGLASGLAVAHQVLAPATDRSLARCHTTVDLGRGDDFAGTSVSVADAEGIVTIKRAVEACAGLWEQGVLVQGAQTAGQPNPQLKAEAPALVGCVDPDGVAAVFPGGQGLCASLGLPGLTEVP